MLRSKKSLLAGKKGEIATTLTVLSLLVILVGTFLGTRRTVQENLEGYIPQAQSTCQYRSKAVVYLDRWGGHVLEQEEMTGPTWGATSTINNIFGPFDEPKDKPKAEKRFDAPDLKPEFRGTSQDVTLTYDPGEYEIIDGRCLRANQFGDIRTCRDFKYNSGSPTLKGFYVDCGIDVDYGWVVRLKNAPTTAPTVQPTVAPSNRPTSVPTVRPTNRPSTAPTVRPTTRPTSGPTPQSCQYRTTISVYKGVIGGPLLAKTEVTATDWGVTNNKKKDQTKPFDKFGTSRATTNINVDPLTFLPENPTAEYRRGESATVRLFGLEGSPWQITDRFCNQRNGSTIGCPANPDANSDKKLISGFTVDCGVDHEYGWVVSRPSPTPSTTPITSPSPTPDLRPCEADVNFVVDSSRSVIESFRDTMTRLESTLRNYHTNHPNSNIEFTLQYFSSRLDPVHEIGSVRDGIDDPLPNPIESGGTNIKQALSEGLRTDATNVFISDGNPTVVTYDSNGEEITCGFSNRFFMQPDYENKTADACYPPGSRSFIWPISNCSQRVQDFCAGKPFREAYEDSKSGKADFSVVVDTGEQDDEFMTSVGNSKIGIDDLPGEFNKILDAACAREEPTPVASCNYHAINFVKECLDPTYDSEGNVTGCGSVLPISDFDVNVRDDENQGVYGTANNRQRDPSRFGDRPMYEFPFNSVNTRIPHTAGEMEIGPGPFPKNAAGEYETTDGYPGIPGEFADVKVYLDRDSRGNESIDYDWKIVGQYCESRSLEDGCGPGIKRYDFRPITDSKISRPDFVPEIKVACNTDVTYGWFLVKNTDYEQLKQADFNRDRVINSLDAAACIVQWAAGDTLPSARRTCDFNGDRKVNSIDYSRVFGFLGRRY